jgi:membrane-bound ClpP family serine protease
VNLTIIPSHLLIVAALYLSWRYRLALLRAVYRVRAARFHAYLEMQWRCRIVCMVGHVDDASADRLIASIRALETSGAILHLLIHTNGGAAQAATRVKHALASYPYEVVADVPGFAWSAGTSIALACDRIVLGPDSVLGPCDRAWTGGDPTAWAVEHVAAHEGGVPIEVIRARQAIEEAAAEVLAYRAQRRALADKRYRHHAANPTAIDEHLVDQLVRGGWGHHWRPIFRADARKLGLDIQDATSASHKDFAELARLTMLSLPEDQR